jgi:hypothetical protein
MDNRVLKPLKEYELNSCKQGKYLPILDKDPVMAARALTKKDLKKSYIVLKEIFEEIRVEENIYPTPLISTLLFSRENFAWFSSFFKEIENILGKRESYNIPFEKCPKINHLKPPVVYQPFYVTSRPAEGFKLRNYRILSKRLHPINNYRIKYIMENYDMSEFIDDAYPAWYLIKDTTVFEQYSEKTNTRVRIDFRDGEFSYFIAGASDNWQKIERVPIEMDHVIAALLFRSYSTDY